MSRKQFHRQKAEYVDKLSTENLIELQYYNGFELDRYYFDTKEEKLYIYTRRRYKVVKPFNNGLMDLITLIDSNGKIHSCSYNKFIKEMKDMDFVRGQGWSKGPSSNLNDENNVEEN